MVARYSECSVPVSESGCSRVSALDGNRNGSVSQMKWVKMLTVDFPLEAVKYKSNYAVSSLWMCGASLMLFIQLYKFPPYWLTLSHWCSPIHSLHFLRINLWMALNLSSSLVSLWVQAHQLPFHTGSFYPLITAKLAISTLSVPM